MALASHTPKHLRPAHEPGLTENLLGSTAAWLARALACTIRFEFHDPFNSVAFQPAIFCIWHDRLALCLEIFTRYIVHHGDQRRLAALVSASRDGAMLSVLLKSYGVEPVRGSSSRRGFQAMKSLIGKLDQGRDLALTPDGPRGPRHQAHHGIITLSQLTGRPIIPVSYRLSRYTSLSTWDLFQIPHPFGSCKVHFGEAIHVERKLEASQRAEVAEALGREMNRLGMEGD